MDYEPTLTLFEEREGVEKQRQFDEEENEFKAQQRHDIRPWWEQ